MFIQILLILLATLHSVSAQPGFVETFDTLDAWEPLTFPKIQAHSRYEIEREDGHSFLVAQSQASASGLVSREELDVFETPRLRWRWRVENVYESAHVLEKGGDDYPIRLYVLFEYDPPSVSFGERVKYRAARLIYGEYPPHSTLNYVWSSAEETPDHYPNPFTDRARMIPLRRGDRDAGQWVEEAVDVLADYRRVFGRDPPQRARLAIMNDSDNTGEAAVSAIDWIRAEAAPPSFSSGPME